MKNHRNIRSIPAASLAVVVLLAGCGDDTQSTLPAVGAAGVGNVTSDRHYNETARFEALKPDVVTWDRYYNETARFEALKPGNVAEYGTAQRLVAESIQAELEARSQPSSTPVEVDAATRDLITAHTDHAEGLKDAATAAKQPTAAARGLVGLVFRPV